MDVIDVRELPEPIARAIEEMVRTLREQYKNHNGKQPCKTTVIEFPVAPGRVIGSLRREDLYDDVQ